MDLINFFFRLIEKFSTLSFVFGIEGIWNRWNINDQIWNKYKIIRK